MSVYDFLLIYMTVKQEINDRIQSKKKLNIIWYIGVTPTTHFSLVFFLFCTMNKLIPF